MARTSDAGLATGGRELTITRLFKAPRELVFRAWTEAEHLAHWPGPKGFTATPDKFDCRTGGSFRTCLHAPDGSDNWVQGSYLEVSPPERLVFTHAWEDGGGHLGPQTIVTVALHEEAGGYTRMHFHQAIFENNASRDGHQGGWTESFDRLEAWLEEAQS